MYFSYGTLLLLGKDALCVLYLQQVESFIFVESLEFERAQRDKRICSRHGFIYLIII